MNAARFLMTTIERRGGRLSVDGEFLVVEPSEAGASLLNELRIHKTEIIGLLRGEAAGMADHDPGAWSDDFLMWLKSGRIMHREGRDDWGGVGSLHIDFCEWAVTHDAVPCTRRTFERLLEEGNFHIADGLVRGVVLLVDLQEVPKSDSLQKSPQAAPAKEANR